MLPTGTRLLLGPGPSPVSPRVMEALAAPPRSHLDPDLVALLDDIRARLTRVFRASDDALTLVDAVTSLGAVPLEVSSWGIDACYSCSQKGLGAPSGFSPVTFSRRALERRVPCRSFYLDIGLLEDYWVRRKYHHTISAP